MACTKTFADTWEESHWDSSNDESYKPSHCDYPSWTNRLNSEKKSYDRSNDNSYNSDHIEFSHRNCHEKSHDKFREYYKTDCSQEDSHDNYSSRYESSKHQKHSKFHESHESHDFKSALHELSSYDFEYRTLDGSNNNKKHPSWGKAGTTFKRLFPPDYKDDVSEPVDNRPNPREVSNAIFDQKHQTQEGKISAFFWLWGQFIDHTLTLTKDSEEEFNIPVPKCDKYFDPNCTGDKFLSFKRSATAKDTGTSPINPRENTNTMSSYLDASNIYGNSHERLKYIRTYYKGTLKTSEGYLPPFNDGKINNAGNSPDNKLFVCGDIRANENLALTSLHTLFIREHNYWAWLIHKDNKKLDDEEIFQRAKLIVEAEIQAITYNEYLPLLLGKRSVRKFPSKYDCDANVQLNNEFATAAYRYGHAMVSKEVKRLNNCGCPIHQGNLDLKEAFFSPYRLCNDGGIEPLLRGFAATSSEKLEAKLIGDLRNFLFGPPGSGGTDLAALNIQRGRDHGLADYKTVRKCLRLKPIHDLRDLTDNPETRWALRKLYNKDLSNADLWVLGLIEKRVDDALVGETFHIILSDQYARLKAGDRFWYERRLPKHLLHLVENTRLSDIIRRNTSIVHIQDDVFSVQKRKCRKY